MYAGVAQRLEHLLAMQKVVGSNPITRSTEAKRTRRSASLFFFGSAESVRMAHSGWAVGYNGPCPARTERGGPEGGRPPPLHRRPFAHGGTRQTSGTKQKAWRSRTGHRFERYGFTRVPVAASHRPDHPRKDDLLGDKRVVSLVHRPTRTRPGTQSLRGTHLAVEPTVGSMAGRTMWRPRGRTDRCAARRIVRSSIPGPDRSH